MEPRVEDLDTIVLGLLRGKLRDVPDVLVLPMDVVSAVCWWHDVKHEEIVGHRRKRLFVDARHAAAWCLRASMRMSFAGIARRLGGRDHKTIINSLKRARERWGLPSADAPGSTLIARHYLKTGEWDVTKAKGIVSDIAA